MFVINNDIINKDWVRNHYDERIKYNISNKHLFYQIWNFREIIVSNIANLNILLLVFYKQNFVKIVDICNINALFSWIKWTLIEQINDTFFSKQEIL